MTERYSYKEIAGLLTDAKANKVPAFFDNLERKMGSEAFRKIFIALTL